MSKSDAWNLFWYLLPYVLPAIAYALGKARNALKLPKLVANLLANPEVLQIIEEGVKAAKAMEGKSDTEKREYVLKWAKEQLYRLLGNWFPDSIVNYLIEHVIVKAKGWS